MEARKQMKGGHINGQIHYTLSTLMGDLILPGYLKQPNLQAGIQDSECEVGKIVTGTQVLRVVFSMKSERQLLRRFI